MSKKVLNTASVINELKGQSAFFRREPLRDSPAEQSEPQFQKPVTKESNKTLRKTKTNNKAQEPDLQAEVLLHGLTQELESNNLGLHDSTHVSMQADNQDDIIETIRKTVKQVGAKTLFIRLTPEEKHVLTSIVFTFNELYRGEGRKTSENEIGRIALKFLLEDYKTTGEQSILAKVLAALNS